MDNAPEDAVEDTPEDTYEPDTVEVNRARQQGNGVGAKDLAYQQDATGPGSDQVSRFGDPAGAQTAGDQAGPPGKPDEDYGDRDADQVDVDFPGA